MSTSLPGRYTWLKRDRCGPYKLAYILCQSLDRFASPEENLPKHSGLAQNRTPNEGKGQHVPTTTSRTDFAHVDDKMASASGSGVISSKDPVDVPVRLASAEKRVMIVDDNNINRSVCQTYGDC